MPETRGSDLFDIYHREVKETDVIRYWWGNNGTGKKFEGIVFFEKGRFLVKTKRRNPLPLYCATEIEIIGKVTEVELAIAKRDDVVDWIENGKEVSFSMEARGTNHGNQD
jgi:hypothetical protein